MRRAGTRRGLASVKTGLGRVLRAAIVAAAILLAFVTVAALAMTRDAGTYNARIIVDNSMGTEGLVGPGWVQG